MPLSTDLHNISDTLMAMALTGTPVPAEEARDLATVLSACALMAEALEATKIAQETADEMARIMDEQREGEAR